MSEPAPTYERRAQMFPKLTPAQIGGSPPSGSDAHVQRRRGPVRAGRRTRRSSSCSTASIEVVQPATGATSADHRPRAAASSPGEVNMLSGAPQPRARPRRPATASSWSRRSRAAPRARPARLRSSSEILMRAFILRRVGLLDERHGDVVLVGSRHSAATLRLKEFLTRNGQPFTLRDVETDPDVQALLDQFQRRRRRRAGRHLPRRPRARNPQQRRGSPSASGSTPTLDRRSCATW